MYCICPGLGAGAEAVDGAAYALLLAGHLLLLLACDNGKDWVPVPLI